jgi:TonB-dependent SusC/RagA subfamily outer membrane receptor
MKKLYLLAFLILFFFVSLSAQNEKDSTGSVNTEIKAGSGPLVIINGEISSTGINWIDPDLIESICVLKDKASTAVFGEAGKNGVIVVSMKDKSKPGTTEERLEDLSNKQHGFKGGGLNEPLVIINGEFSSTGLKWINPDKIKTISILKDQSAIAVFGEAGKNGVIVVTADEYPGPVIR